MWISGSLKGPSARNLTIIFMCRLQSLKEESLVLLFYIERQIICISPLFTFCLEVTNYTLNFFNWQFHVLLFFHILFLIEFNNSRLSPFVEQDIRLPFPWVYSRILAETFLKSFLKSLLIS